MKSKQFPSYSNVRSLRTDIAFSNGESPETIDLKGATITIDAMGTQTAIAQQIQDSDANYILTLKANHPTLASGSKCL